MSQTNETGTICFEQSPCGMLVLDSDKSIVQVNEAMASMVQVPAEGLVGKNAENLKPIACRVLLNSEGLIHLSGPEIKQEKWLFCTESEGSSHSVRFYQDLTEEVRMKQEIGTLRRQVEDLTITDALTGLANPRALNRVLNSQVTRSRRYHNPLCLAVLELIDTNHPQDELEDEAILATSRHLRDRLRWVDTIARWDHNHFVVILPETQVEQGTDLLEKICAELSDIDIASSRQDQALRLSFGLAQWEKGYDSRILMERAAEALNNGSESPLATAVT